MHHFCYLSPRRIRITYYCKRNAGNRKTGLWLGEEWQQLLLQREDGGGPAHQDIQEGAQYFKILPHRLKNLYKTWTHIFKTLTILLNPPKLRFIWTILWFYSEKQCGGSGSVESVSGSVESVSFSWIRIRIKKWLLDLESGSVSNDTDPYPTKTNANIK